MDSRLTTPLPYVLNTANGQVGRILGTSVKKDVKKRETGHAIGRGCNRVFRGNHGHSIFAFVT